MPGKARPGASSAKGPKSALSRADTDTQAVLQAVVLADSFQDRYKPFTVEKPRCLLPLANMPLIEYTFEFLAANHVQEVFIYCGAHTDQVEDYVARSRWSAASRASPFSLLQFIRVSDARSVGDVLRDMDKRTLVSGDFLVVHGDLVSNVTLAGPLAAHRKRREENAANIMTLVLTSGGDDEHRTKSKGITPVFAIDTKTHRCLHYDEMSPRQGDRYLSLDPAIPEELSTSFDVRSDLIDAQIDICTPDVLALWSESFDYELPRRNFLHGVLKDWELNGKMIYADVLDQGYAARASNLQMYDALSRDVLGRWTFPLIPENNIMPKQSYKRHNGDLSVESGVQHASDAQLSNTVIGRNSSIGAGSRVSNCVIGRDCRIGANVTIENCYLWSDVVIDDGATIAHSILADWVAVGKGCSIPAGCLLSFGARLGDGIKLSDGAVISTLDHQGKPVTPDTLLLGADTNAAPFADPELEELDDEDPSRLQRTLLYSLADLNLSASTISTLASGPDSDQLDDELLVDGAASSTRSRLSSFASDDSVSKTSFHLDAVHGLVDALRADSGDFDSAKLEFMGLRLANNASDEMMRKAVATAFVRRAVELLTPGHGAVEPSKAAETVFTARPGASKFLSEVGVGGVGERDQVEFILAMQRALLRPKVAPAPESSRLGTLLAALMQQLYALDILEEDGILSWWRDGRTEESEAMRVLKERCRVLVEWLENAEEEEDEDEDESDDE